jgi:transcriptional accessory protein Tex/SPT6
MKAAGFEATPAEEMDFAPAEATKKPTQTVQEVVAEIVEEEEVDIDAIKAEIANCTKLKQLTDLYFGYKQLFDSNEMLKRLLSMKKENLTKK